MKQFALIIIALACTTISAAEYTVLQRYTGVMEARDFDQYKTVQDTAPYRRRTIDLSLISAELDIKINPLSKIEIEVEFEHGGTGTAMEFDSLEEFGEFESEVERGGEVAIEEAFYLRHITGSTDIIVGKAPVYFSLTGVQRKPLLYAGTRAANLEERMIPIDWAEPGLQLRQRWSDFTFRFGLLAGLNSEFFRKYNWIGGGYQRQFETVTFDNPAWLASIEWGDVAQGRGVAFSYYTGDTTKNRRKTAKVVGQSNVDLWSFMASWRLGRVALKGQSMVGQLQNSEQIALQNGTLSGLASPGAFSALGSQAVLQTLELDYEFVDSWTAFGKWEHVNTFDRAQGQISEHYVDPRYNVTQSGFGLTHIWDDVCAFKLEYIHEATKLVGLPATTTYVAQFIFDTGSF